MGRLHFMGTPLVLSQREATQKQIAFLGYASNEYIMEERQFMADVMGAKMEKGSNDVRDRGISKLKNPNHVKRKNS